MSSNEDSDIKIFGKKSAESANAENSDTAELAAELEKEKANGNIALAKALGKKLAEDVPNDFGDSAFGVDGDDDETPELLYQRKVLMAFAAESGLQRYCPTSLLASAAINSFYEKLMDDSPEFYDNISDGGAFTFYYLNLRRGGEVEKNIGHTFAMLCGKENDSLFQELGSTLYLRFNDVVKDMVGKTGFVG